ncbi:hypothetical protein JQ615_41720 [Bradyrhizobium jicamae]|uniref:Uncharacterized protein n=1 Tax=Bradyrhizobium jicamae TaxID=280332 RepID=A0ABS5FYP9_9BRAD|nr:hypothetical protein [Bradyrhizobium jicamae]MBR0801850.1 hypothetical protein [Bradyrhizobium jicamae]MBR0934338.1 hypothetical protein [Bradyrhizobium jicamae]
MPKETPENRLGRYARHVEPHNLIGTTESEAVTKATEAQIDDCIKAARDLVERAMYYGLSEDEAWRLASAIAVKARDEVVRKKRSKFKVIIGGREWS